MSNSFLVVDSVNEGTPFNVPAYYVSWIASKLSYRFYDSSNMIQIGASNSVDKRTVITVAKDWRISCVINNDEKGN
ncbi:hypothetical protein [Glutamicibacter protophormiae]|uniref:hypothetical protein n=1 Tax=Glutamicibacter protophormiae TaxID=37930 RepID=UPI0033178A30